MRGPTRVLTLVRNGHNEHLAGRGGLEGTLVARGETKRPSPAFGTV